MQHLLDAGKALVVYSFHVLHHTVRGVVWCGVVWCVTHCL
jgi:hypothetical protein